MRHGETAWTLPALHTGRTAELAMPRSIVEADDDLMEWDYGAYEGRSTDDIEVERPGWRLLFGTASLGVLGYDHDLTEPVIHAWNGRPTAVAVAQCAAAYGR